MTDCTHEFFAATRGGHPALGIRFTANSGANTAGMLYVGGVEVTPNRAYALRVVYQTTGGYNTGDVRVREQQTNRLRIVGQNRLTYTAGQWTTLLLPYKNGNTDKIQIEFHHNGPLGAENELSVRSLEVLDAEPR